ncbi:oligopeptide/dipeptide ABC transporter ATP-binding protein, partial [Kitasatospora sp. NPDC004799]|uniref:oligopeptide/dipeptide ABC transporter ATP-binding protein n=1 Tax=Kitasatospora sp. NPDC004799 TaxID=3154460 RepID=UPI0033B40C69
GPGRLRLRRVGAGRRAVRRRAGLPGRRGRRDRAVPRVTGPLRRTLPAIPGSPPDLSRTAVGCPFAPRCERATELCTTTAPPRQGAADGHTADCHFPLGAPGDTAPSPDELEPAP